MPNARNLRIRTWSGPVDLGKADVDGWDGSAWKRVGGREQLERWEKRTGRVMLRVDGVSGSFVTLSRQAPAYRMPGDSEVERTYGRELGHALLLMDIAGASQRNLRLLGVSGATCGATDVAIDAIRCAAALIGGGANRWAAECAATLRRDPNSLSRLSLLVDRHGAARGSVKPRSLASALNTASALHAAKTAARAAGAEAVRAPHEPHFPSAPKPASADWEGWEVVATPRENAAPELLRAAAQLGQVHVTSEGGAETVCIRIEGLDHLKDAVAWLARHASGLVTQPETDCLLDTGLPGFGLRFRFCAEFGPLPPHLANLVTDGARTSEPGRALRRETEDGRMQPATVARHVGALGEKVASMPVNRATRIVRLAREGFDPEGFEWRALMESSA